MSRNRAICRLISSSYASYVAKRNFIGLSSWSQVGPKSASHWQWLMAADAALSLPAFLFSVAYLHFAHFLQSLTKDVCVVTRGFVSALTSLS